MKLGVSVATYASQFGPIVFRDGSLRDSLATIKTLGYDGVDLFADCKTDEQIDEIRALFAEHQLEVAMYIAIFLSEQGVNLSDRSDAARQASLDAYKTQIEKAHRLGAQRVPVGYLRGQRAADDPPEAYCERLAASLDPASPHSVTSPPVLGSLYVWSRSTVTRSIPLTMSNRRWRLSTSTSWWSWACCWICFI